MDQLCEAYVDDTFFSESQFCRIKSTQRRVSLVKREKFSVLIFRKFGDEECNFYVFDIIKVLQQNDCDVYLEAKNLEEIIGIGQQSNIQLSGLNQYQPNHEKIIDLLVTIGGDGTVLQKQSIITIKRFAMKHFQQRTSPPILSFEKGTLGFMCVYNLDNFQSKVYDTIQHIRDKEFVIEKKDRIKGTLIGQSDQEITFHALNEFVISRGSNPNVLKLEIYINNLLLTESIGDGLIISTPNGSTAYSLSAGGPIVQNEVTSITISPICPLSLSFRPIVLPMCMNISIRLSESSRGPGQISADGQVQYQFGKQQTFMISQSKYSVSMIVPQEEVQFSDWVSKLKQMLNWNNKYTVQTKETYLSPEIKRLQQQLAKKIEEKKQDIL